jgi:ssDNA-binding Zn-finger/Zn-ribbon topoisomerase 1
MDQREARDEAIERVSSAAGNDWWKPYAMKAVYEAACMRQEITSDDVWRVLHEHRIRDPKENRVMGPVMIEAQRRGWLKQTDRTRISDDPSSPNHSRPQRVYISRIVGGALPSWERRKETQVDHTPPPGSASPGMAGRPFPLRRNDDGTVELVTQTCPECGDEYAIEADHKVTYSHRKAAELRAATEGQTAIDIPAQPPIAQFDKAPEKPVFGEMLICPTCKGMRRTVKRQQRPFTSTVAHPNEPCLRCGGIGIIPNQGPIA